MPFIRFTRDTTTRESGSTTYSEGDVVELSPRQCHRWKRRGAAVDCSAPKKRGRPPKANANPLDGMTIAQLQEFAAGQDPVIEIPDDVTKKADIRAAIDAALAERTAAEGEGDAGADE